MNQSATAKRRTGPYYDNSTDEQALGVCFGSRLEAGNIEAAKKILHEESTVCILGLDELAGRNATPEA